MIDEFKFLCIGDLHIGKLNTYFKENHKELLKEYFQLVINYCNSNGIDHIIQLGDIFNKATPTQEEVEQFIGLLDAMEQNNISFYAITGNHDYKYQQEKNDTINTVCSTQIIEKMIALKKFKNIYIYSKPSVQFINGFPFVFLPFPEYNTPATKELKQAVYLLHIDINGYSMINSGVKTEIKHGLDVKELKDNNLYLCGHIHEKQHTTEHPNIYFLGSPFQLSFGETTENGEPEPKSLQVVTLEKKENGFNYSLQEVFLPSVYQLKNLFITSKKDLDNLKSTLELYNTSTDRLTLKIQINTSKESESGILNIPKEITEDIRIHKIQTKNTANFEAISSISALKNSLENSIDIEDTNENQLKESIIQYATNKYNQIQALKTVKTPDDIKKDTNNLTNIINDLWKIV